ncbi:Transposase, Ptta/En/Spm, plant [Corchorus olitorius]|uniref:Transposase, Ptta/En/Spm, plant n=1 Tax=Corchorus olitorius TaxID=93759 RepID=A0A1R3G878_9ROSI|nr:Transposase, Ptta/En/Spm, plant [Corchorus olitorius]
MTRGKGKRHCVHKMRDKGSSTRTVQVDTHDNVNLNMENPSATTAPPFDVPTMNHPTVDFESPREENAPLERVETDDVHNDGESATTAKRKTRGHNRGRSIPTDPSQRLQLTVINEEAKRNACQAAKIDRYDPNADWSIVKSCREDGFWIPQPVWDSLVDNVWSTDQNRKFAELASNNRNSKTEGHVSKHTAGSCSFSKTKHIMIEKDGEAPSQLQFFTKTHTRKMDKYNSALKEKHGDEGYDKVDLDLKALTDSIEAVGKRNRSHLYGFSSLEGQRVLLKGSSSQRPTIPSTSKHQNEGLAQMITQALSEILPRILPHILPGMLISMGFSPSANRSGDNVVSPSSQHDSEATESEDGNDGENGDRMNLG